MATGRVRWYGLFSLVIIAAFLAEFLTGSNSIPQVIAYPPSLLFNVALYGSGALLIREASVRWRKRWATVLLLGGAYAVGEEGFAAKTMISPNSPIIGNQSYSHWMDQLGPISCVDNFPRGFQHHGPDPASRTPFPRDQGPPTVGQHGVGPHHGCVRAD